MGILHYSICSIAISTVAGGALLWKLLSIGMDANNSVPWMPQDTPIMLSHALPDLICIWII